MDGSAVFGRLPATDVVGIADRSSQSIRDAGYGVTAGTVTGCSDISGSISDFDRTLGKIRLRNGGVAASVGFFQNSTRGGIGTFL